MQGWRISMEDSHTAILDLLKATSSGATNGATPSDAADQRMAFFGVYDGHGGHKVALFAGENIYNILTKQEKFKSGEYSQALKDGFLATDSAILSDPKHEDEVSGCTACVGLITNDKIYIANAGDSRCVLGTKGRAKPLSQDHKPQLESEKARIQAAGGFVDFGRVNGNLALSRAIGDFEFKKSADLSPEAQIVTAYPDVEVHTFTEDDEFMVLACDGIWDCQSSQAVIEFVRRGIVAKQELDKICENMMDNCLASNSETGGVGCDNMTMIVIGFLRGRSKEEWYEEIAKRVAAGDGPCAPPEYAEFRGPGVHHNFDDGDAEFDTDGDIQHGNGVGPYHGRIILLGDGTEVITETDDNEMLENAEEDRDLDSQVLRVKSPESDSPAKSPTLESKDEKKAEEPKKEQQSTTSEKQSPAAAKNT
jgi:protein phosphatase 2C family protein 2/3